MRSVLKFCDRHFDLVSGACPKHNFRAKLKKVLASCEHTIDIGMVEERKLLTDLIDRDPKLAKEDTMMDELLRESKNLEREIHMNQVRDIQKTQME